MKEYTIGANEAGQRFDKYLAKCMKKAPKSFFYKMLRKKNITLNQKKATGSEILSEGDLVKIFVSDETFEKFSEQETVASARTTLSIVYEDSDIVLINKPAGMLSQPDQSGKPSLVEYLNGYLLESGAFSEQDLRTFHPAAANRLDRNTSGIVACGKSLRGLQELSRMFHDRTVHKYYRCLVEGVIRKPARIHGYLYKDEKTNKVFIHSEEIPGSSAIETRYLPIADNGERTLLEVELITGKAHQIRAHLSSIGHPILGDPKYNTDVKSRQFAADAKIRHQLLHAARLEFPPDCALPDLSGRSFTASLSDEFERVLKKIKLRGDKNNE